MEPSESRAAPIAGVYFGYFAALGVAGPFLALFLERRGFSPADAAYLLAVLPITRILSTPAWTLLADRLHSASAVLRIVGIGAMLTFAILGFTASHALIVLALVLFTIFRSPTTSLIDVLALQWARTSGSDFGQLRAWGTIGFTAATFGLGFVIRAGGVGWMVNTAVALLALTTLGTFGLPAGAAPQRVPLLRALGALLKRPRFTVFLLTAMLHQIGLAAYDGLFAAHVSAISNASFAGMAVALGAGGEVVFMLAARRVLPALGLENTLALAYGASAVRWLLCAYVREPHALIVVQLLHALTFGAFYTAAVALVDRESPPEIRASAQGVFGAFTWGVASAIALLVAGTLENWGGMRAVFLAGAVGAALATPIALAMNRRS